MSTYTKELTNPKTEKKQVALCLDNYFGPHEYGYVFKKDGTDFKLTDEVKDVEIYEHKDIV